MINVKLPGHTCGPTLTEGFISFKRGHQNKERSDLMREKEDKPSFLEVFAKNCTLQLFTSYIVYLCVPEKCNNQ